MSTHRAAGHALSREQSALLVIDMQRYFLEESSHALLPRARGIIDNVHELLASYRRLSLPIIHTRHALLRNESPGAMGRWWRDVLYDGDRLSEIVPELQPLRGESVIRKTRYSAFARTDLEEVLRRKGATDVLITGVMTHLCCETTARDAFMRDFNVFFVVDATASRTDDLHVSSLKTLADGFAIPVTTAEVLKWLKQ